MPTRREQILVALFAVLQAADVPAVTRNQPLAEIGEDGFCNLVDGGIEPGEEFINPPIYEFTMTPAVQIVVPGTDPAARDAELDRRIAAVNAVLPADLDLSEFVTAVRPRPADYAPEALWGAPDMKGAEIVIEIDYWSDSSAG